MLGAIIMNRREKVILILMGFIVILGVGSDTILKDSMPEILISRVDNLSDFEMVIYQIQATITTLGIALITILSGVSHDTLYGISIAHYILQKRSRVLNHKNIITILIAFILVNYLFISFNMFNSVVASLFVTALLILSMTFDIFTIFKGRKFLESEIGDYIIKNSSDVNILDIVFKDAKTAIDREEMLRFKENMNLILKLLHESRSFIESEKTLKEKWENGLAEIFADAFKKTRGMNLKMVFSYFESVYKTISNEFYKPEEVALWDKISIEFFIALKVYDVEDIEDLSIFSSIRREVYKCQYCRIEDDEIHRNNHSIDYLFNRIYYVILSNKNKVANLNKSIIVRTLKDYYDCIYRDIKNSKNKEITPILMNEFRNYTKLLIDNREGKVLEKTLVSQLKIYPRNTMNDELTAHYLTIIIYLFYLAKREVLVEEEQKEFAKNIFMKIRQVVSEFLLFTSFQRPLKHTIVDKVRKNLKWWEYIPEDGKWMIMDSVIDSFLLFHTTYTDKDTVTLKESVEAIIRSNVFGFVSEYTGNKKVSVAKNYKEFIIDMYNVDNISDSDIENDLNRFENVLFGIYKDKMMEDGEKESLTTDEILRFKESIQDKIFKKVQANFEVFNRHEEGVEYEVGTEEIEITTEIKKDSHSIQIMIKEFIDVVFNYFVGHIIKVLLKNKQIVYEEIYYRDKNALIKLFDLIATYNINVNTLIGYRDWYYGYEKELEFKRLEAESIQIKASKLSDIMVCVDSSKIIINSLKCKVEIVDIDFEEYKNSLEKDEEGYYLYNITNDIFLPFEEEELERLISITRKKIRIKFDYQYSFNDDISGVAVIFKSKND